MSAESGLKTFREMGGLWEEYDISEVATPQAWERNPKLVLDFYNQRRKQLVEAKPNNGHLQLVNLEKHYNVHIITQNVDDLHERAGSKNILHLHGELKKVRSTIDENLVYSLENWELNWGDKCDKGSQLRPHIVWFGEAVPNIPIAISIVEKADILVVIGTSLNVYPAAGLLEYANKGVPIYIIDPETPAYPTHLNIHHIKEKAGIGVSILNKELIKDYLK